MKGISKVLYSLLVAFMVATLASSALAQGSEPPIPPATVNGNYVLDQLDWLTTEQEAEINAIVSELDTHNMAQIAVVTQNDCGADSQTYRNTFFRTWGIGHKEKNDGLLILVCWYDGDTSRRKLEQEVGYGLEGMIPDTMTARVAQQYFVAAFKTGKEAAQVVADHDAGAALVRMVKAYDGIIRGDTPVELQKTEGDGSSALSLLLIILVILVVLIVLIAWLSDGSGYSGGYSSGGSSSSGSSSPSSSSSWGGGSSGGGGSSSNF
jgi:uncharacterized protein